MARDRVVQPIVQDHDTSDIPITGDQFQPLVGRVEFDLIANPPFLLDDPQVRFFHPFDLFERRVGTFVMERARTAGFWKNCTGQWPISTSTKRSSVYQLSSCANTCGFGNLTVLQALGLKGGTDVCGSIQILLRAAASAYLNSLKVAYLISTADLVSQVNAALASCNRNTILTLATTLDADNNLGCKDATGTDLPCRK